jgi:hypothetical protein
LTRYRWPIASRVGIVLAGLFVTLVLLELAYAVGYYGIRHHKTYYQVRRELGSARLYVPDPDLGYRSAPNLRNKLIDTPPLPNAPRRHGGLVNTDAHGFRYDGVLASPKPPGEIRIFSLGGSTTYGFVSNRQTYPARLQQMFAGDPRVKVINVGVGGYRSIHLLTLFTKVVRRLEPDIITIHDGWNDYEDYFEPYWRPKDPHGNALLSQLRVYGAPLSRLALGHLFVRAYFAAKGYDRREPLARQEDYVRRHRAAAGDPRWLDEYESNLQELIALAKRDGVLPILILFPSPYFRNAAPEVKAFADENLNTWGRWDGFVVALEAVEKRLRDLEHRNGIPLIDANAEFEKYNADYQRKFDFFMDTKHLTEEGERLLATTMYPCVRRAVELVRARGREVVKERTRC